MGYTYLITDKGVEVYRMEDSSIAFTGHLKGKLYLVDFTSNTVNPKTCLMAKSSMGWLWHRQLAHVGMRNLAKLQKIGFVAHAKWENKLEINIPSRML